MLNISINKQQKAQFSVSSLTQSVNTGIMDMSTATPSANAVHHFTHTMMSSVTSSTLYVMGDGSFDATKLTKIIVHQSREQDLEVGEVVRKLRGYLAKWATNPDLLRGVIGAFTGSSNKGVRANQIRQMPSTQVRELVAKLAPHDNPLFPELMTDWLTSVLAHYHWITPGYRFVYEVDAPKSFPKYKDLVETVASHDIRRMLDALGGIDRSVITTHIESGKTAVSVGLIAQELAHGVSNAIKRIKGSHVPENVADALLVLCGQAWTPSTGENDTLAPRSILESDVVQMFSSNLALFLIYQERVAGGARLSMEFDYNVIKDDILPLVREAITEISPFKIRPISDTVAHIHKSSVRDHRGLPTMTIIHEDISYPEKVNVFTRTQIDSRSKHRMLTLDSNISEQMSSALIPVTSQFSVEKMVRQKYHTAELIQPDVKLTSLGSKTTVMFPSFLERLPRDSDIIKDWSKFAAEYTPLSKRFVDPSAEQEKANVESFGECWRDYADVMLDHYKYIVHLAVNSVNDVQIMAFDLEIAEYTLGLQWSMDTDLKTPIGRSQITGGRVTTTEPLEVLQYVKDIVASNKLVATAHDIEAYEDDGLHAWNWKDQSTSLDFKTTYLTALRGHDYSVDIDMRHLLGLTMARKNLRFMDNRLAAVTVQLWFHEMFEQIKSMKAIAKKTKDDIKSATYHAQLSALNILMAKQLIAIGGTSMGKKGTSYIKHSIQRLMFDLGSLDDYTHLHVGVQATLLNLWMGLTTLEYLNLLCSKDIQTITEHIRSSGVLAHVVAGSVDMPE
jgi:hypothetical protein